MVKVILFCGVMETAIWVQRDPQDMPAITGRMVRRSIAVHRTPHLELEKTGVILAMIAVAGQVGLNLSPHQQTQWVAFFFEKCNTQMKEVSNCFRKKRTDSSFMP
jgi:hypothetical protein